MKSLTESLNWIDQQVGKSLNFDGAYGAQCVDLIEYYLQFHGISPFYGNAADWWEKQYTGGGNFTLQSSPQPGDIAVFRRNASNGNFGHISLVRSVATNTFTSLDQNWVNSSPNGSPAAWVTHTKGSNVLGYIRPKFNGGTNMAYISDAELADYKTWKANGMALQKERDETLYPYVNDVSDALGIPRKADKGLAQLAIKQLKDAAKPTTPLPPANTIILTKGIYEVK